MPRPLAPERGVLQKAVDLQVRASRAEAEVDRLRAQLFAAYQLANRHDTHPTIIEALEAELFRSKQ